LLAGNNAVEMQTTAHYDQATGEFIINTPTTLAQKYWITNSAVHAKWAVIFAQLYIGGRNEGIHGFLVRIRNEVEASLQSAVACFTAVLCVITRHALVS
jgi:acyl-CoA oxidase